MFDGCLEEIEPGGQWPARSAAALQCCDTPPWDSQILLH